MSYFSLPKNCNKVTDLKREEEALQKKLADHIKEKAALEGEVAKLRHEKADLVADVETLIDIGATGATGH